MQVCTPCRQPRQHPTTQFFYRPDALPDAQPTVSKHCICQKSLNFTYAFKCYQQNCSWLHFTWPTLIPLHLFYKFVVHTQSSSLPIKYGHRHTQTLQISLLMAQLSPACIWKNLKSSSTSTFLSFATKCEQLEHTTITRRKTKCYCENLHLKNNSYQQRHLAYDMLNQKNIIILPCFTSIDATTAVKRNSAVKKIKLDKWQLLSASIATYSCPASAMQLGGVCHAYSLVCLHFAQLKFTNFLPRCNKTPWVMPPSLVPSFSWFIVAETSVICLSICSAVLKLYASVWELIWKFKA